MFTFCLMLVLKFLCCVLASFSISFKNIFHTLEVQKLQMRFGYWYYEFLVN